MEGLRLYYPVLNSVWTASGKALTVAGLQEILKEIKQEISLIELNNILAKNKLEIFKGEDSKINRRYLSVILDSHLRLFEKQIDHSGNLK